MSTISNILSSQRNSSGDEVNRSSPNLNTKSGCDTSDISSRQVSKSGGDDNSQSISKSQQTISVSFSNSDNADNVMNVNQPDQGCNDTTLNVSFKQLSRRESSLENLAEDDIKTQLNTSASDNSVIYFVQKSEAKDDIKDFTRKPESSSRFRRTMHSLFSCCSSKSRRTAFVAKIDCNTEHSTELEIESGAGQIIRHKDHRGLNCLRLRKFFDILDEPDSSAVNRSSPVRQAVVTTVPYRDGDKTDSPSRKAGDNGQSENGGANLTRSVLLGPIKVSDQGRKCFIIDLDETLVHSSFKMVDKADFKVGVDIEGTVHTVYVLKRPYVDIFLQNMGRIFECVLFTASLAKYADPVTDFLDKWRVFRWRLFRESCVFHRGNYVKDLGMLGRPTDQIAILDNSPASYMFHPDSAVQITSWFDDPKDTALLDLIPYLEQLAHAPSVPAFLAAVKPPPKATVPVSIMLPLPSNNTPTMSINPPLAQPPPLLAHHHNLSPAQSSSPITSVSPHIDPATITPPYNRALLPFSPCRCLSKSLSSLLPLIHDSASAVHQISRSEGALSTSSSSSQCFIPLLSRRLVRSGGHRISRSLSDLRPPPLMSLTILDKSYSASTPSLTHSPPPTSLSPRPVVIRSLSFSLRSPLPRNHSPTRSRSFNCHWRSTT